MFVNTVLHFWKDLGSAAVAYRLIFVSLSII